MSEKPNERNISMEDMKNDLYDRANTFIDRVIKLRDSLLSGYQETSLSNGDYTVRIDRYKGGHKKISIIQKTKETITISVDSVDEKFLITNSNTKESLVVDASGLLGEALSDSVIKSIYTQLDKVCAKLLLAIRDLTGD